MDTKLRAAIKAAEKPLVRAYDSTGVARVMIDDIAVFDEDLRTRLRALGERIAAARGELFALLKESQELRGG